MLGLLGLSALVGASLVATTDVMSRTTAALAVFAAPPSGSIPRAAARRLAERVGNASGARQVRCLHLKPPHGGYNFSFAAQKDPKKRPTRSTGIQYCCLSPRREDIVKSRSAPPRAGASAAETAASFTFSTHGASGGSYLDSDGRGPLVTGADGSQWTLGMVGRWEWKCLPSFVVAGTQKSGSTALTAYLLSHPQVPTLPTQLA